MKLHALQLLLLVVAAVLAAPCTTTVCRASMTVVGRPPKCDLVALRSCAPATIYGANPSRECCAKLRGLIPCLCMYYRKTLGLRRYINSQEGRKIAAVCRVPRPKC